MFSVGLMLFFFFLDQNLPLPDVVSDQLRNHVETILQKLPQDLQLVLKRDTYSSSGNGENISTLTTNEQHEDINDQKKWKRLREIDFTKNFVKCEIDFTKNFVKSISEPKVLFFLFLKSC